MICFQKRNVYGNVKLNITVHLFQLTDLTFYINNMFVSIQLRAFSS